jgi:hypothetical protein
MVPVAVFTQPDYPRADMKNMCTGESSAGRIRRLNLTVPFTFRRLEGGLEEGASRGAARASRA